MARDGSRALLLVLVMFSAAFAGCFGENELDSVNSEDDVVITPQPYLVVFFRA